MNILFHLLNAFADLSLLNNLIGKTKEPHYYKCTCISRRLLKKQRKFFVQNAMVD